MRWKVGKVVSLLGGEAQVPSPPIAVLRMRKKGICQKRGLAGEVVLVLTMVWLSTTNARYSAVCSTANSWGVLPQSLGSDLHLWTDSWPCG